MIAPPAMSRTVAAPATERILDDGGGRIGSYLTRYEAIRKSGQHVAIDGTCASACTLLLGVIPHNRICVTPRAVLAFHAAWDLSLTGAQTNEPGTKYLWSHHPTHVRRWIARHGGLRSQTIYLAGGNWRQCFRAAASGGRTFYCALAAPHVATMTALKTSNDCKLTRHRVAGSGVMLSVSPAATLCDLPLMLSNTLSLAGRATTPSLPMPPPTIHR